MKRRMIVVLLVLCFVVPITITTSSVAKPVARRANPCTDGCWDYYFAVKDYLYSEGVPYQERIEIAFIELCWCLNTNCGPLPSGSMCNGVSANIFNEESPFYDINEDGSSQGPMYFYSHGDPREGLSFEQKKHIEELRESKLKH